MAATKPRVTSGRPLGFLMPGRLFVCRSFLQRFTALMWSALARMTLRCLGSVMRNSSRARMQFSIWFCGTPGSVGVVSSRVKGGDVAEACFFVRSPKK